MPDGVHIRFLEPHSDHRGTLREAIRCSWFPLQPALQWNLIDSAPHVMRGMHAHLRYDEYYLVLDGTVLLGMRDTRPGSPTLDVTSVCKVSADQPCVVAVPAGLVHGVYCATASRFMVGLAAEWSGDGELGCHWRDPALGIDWHPDPVVLSANDDSLPPLSELQPRIPFWRAAN